LSNLTTGWLVLIVRAIIIHMCCRAARRKKAFLTAEGQ